MGKIILLNNYEKPFKSVQPKELVYRLKISTKECSPMVVKEIVRDSPGIMRLILYRDILPSEKIIEALNNPEYDKGTPIPEFHCLVDGNCSSFTYSILEKDKTKQVYYMATELSIVQNFMTK